MDAAILHFFEGLRCPVLDGFFGAWTALGDELLIAAAVVLLYLLLPRRAGEQALIAVLGAACLTAWLKGSVRRPRPYAAGVCTRVPLRAPLFSTLDLDADRSFPSGHAAGSCCLAATLAFHARKRALSLFAGAALVCIALSRIYLGVHYPSDVLAGLALGGLCAAFWQWVYRRFYGARLRIFGAAAAALALALCFARITDVQTLRVTALTAGTAAGMLLSDILAPAEDVKGWKSALWRILLAAAAAALFFLPAHFLLAAEYGRETVSFFCAAFAATGIAPLLFKKLRL